MTGTNRIQFECALMADQLDALERLVSETVSVDAPRRHIAVAASLLLLSRVDGKLRGRLFASDPDRVLVQDQLLIECRHALNAGETVRLTAEVPAEIDAAGVVGVRVNLTTLHGDELVAIKASLRHVAAAAIDQATGLSLERLARRDVTRSLSCRPISEGAVARYAELASDGNALHRTPGAVVPGAFLATIAESLAVGPGDRPRRIGVRFIAPIRAGESFDVVVLRHGPRSSQSGLRLLFVPAMRGVAAIADVETGEFNDAENAASSSTLNGGVPMFVPIGAGARD